MVADPICCGHPVLLVGLKQAVTCTLPVNTPAPKVLAGQSPMVTVPVTVPFCSVLVDVVETFSTGVPLADTSAGMKPLPKVPML